VTASIRSRDSNVIEFELAVRRMRTRIKNMQSVIDDLETEPQNAILATHRIVNEPEFKRQQWVDDSDDIDEEIVEDRAHLIDDTNPVRVLL
jgi:predicted transposase YdaD